MCEVPLYRPLSVLVNAERCGLKASRVTRRERERERERQKEGERERERERDGIARGVSLVFFFITLVSRV